IQYHVQRHRPFRRSRGRHSSSHREARSLLSTDHGMPGSRGTRPTAQRRGNHFHVRIDLTVPGDEIVIAHNGSLYATAQDTQIYIERVDDEADAALADR